MKVFELMAKLEACDMQAEVFVPDPEGKNGDEVMECTELDIDSGDVVLS